MKTKMLCVLSLFIFSVIKNEAQINMDSLAKEATKTEQWQPVPPVVSPGKNCGAPISFANIWIRHLEN